MSKTPIQDAVRSYALAQVGAAYVMGATAQRCTPSMRRALANGRSSAYAAQIVGACPVLSGKQSSCDGCRYQGRLAFDCAQLSRYAAKAGGITLPSGSNSQWTKVDWAARGEIAGMPMDVVCFVFHVKDGKMSHVGVYLGDGTVADARGHAYGVLHKDVTGYPWTHYAIPEEIAEEAGLMNGVTHETYGEVCHSTLRMGSTGAEVVRLQELLAAHGAEALTADGIFGALTLSAVKAFQAENGLTVDGVVGPLTWAALEAYAEEIDQEELQGEDVADDEPQEDPSSWDAMVQEMREVCGQAAAMLDRLCALIDAAEGMHNIES